MKRTLPRFIEIAQAGVDFVGLEKVKPKVQLAIEKSVNAWHHTPEHTKMAIM